MPYGTNNLLAPLSINPVTGELTGFTTGAGLTLHGGATVHGASGALALSTSGATALTILLNGVEKARFSPTTGNLLIGGLTTDGTGVLQLPAGAADKTSGMTFGADTNFHRTAAGVLRMRNTAAASTTTQLVFEDEAVGSAAFISTSAGVVTFVANRAAGTLTLGTSNATGGNVLINVANTLAATVAPTGLTVVGSLTTTAPTGGAGAWELGVQTVSGTSVLLTDRFVGIEIGGTLVKLAVVSNA